MIFSSSPQRLANRAGVGEQTSSQARCSRSKPGTAIGIRAASGEARLLTGPDRGQCSVFFGRDHYSIYHDNEAEAIQKYFQEHVEEVLEVKEEAK